MPILTKPATINKNVAASLTLDKALLKVHASITDSYYQDDANWSKVVFNYRNSFGQREAVIFDASQPTPTKDFLVSDKARSSDFQLQSISIIDYDGGKFKMRRSAIATIVAIADISFESVNTLPAPSIIAGAYAVGSNPMQNLTSPSPAEGQSFVLSSPASVSSVKVMISKYSELPLTGTLNMTLKASDYLGSGTEVVSTNTLDLSTLAISQPTLDGGVICEFLFDTPVSLPSGTNSIKYNYAGLNVSGSVFIQVWGYSPSIGDGAAYSYGGAIAHVDFWFQIIGN